MIKRLIFDIDNTLIMWKDNYVNELDKIINKFEYNITKEDIDKTIDDMEYKYDKLSKESLLNDLNRIGKGNFDNNFVDSILNEQKFFAELDNEVIEVLDYLSKKYELVILSNYFREVQIERLQKAGILHYFIEIYCGDDVPLKPRKESFEKAIGNWKKEECMMIGDNLELDIHGAINFGIKAILCDYKNKLKDNDNYTRITNIKELKDIL